MAILYDHEEVGSKSAQGAACTIIKEIPERIFSTYKNIQEQDLYIAKTNSMIWSMDTSLAFHPNYPQHYQLTHICNINGGPIVSISPM